MLSYICAHNCAEREYKNMVPHAIIDMTTPLKSITDEDPSLRTESFAIINLRGVSTKLN